MGGNGSFSDIDFYPLNEFNAKETREQPPSLCLETFSVSDNRNICMPLATK